MERLTKNKPVAEMSMYELAHNCCYAKDGYARYRDFDTDIDARDLARDLMVNYGFWEIDSDEMLSDEIFDEAMLDNLQYGSKEMEGLIALFYNNLWAMADLHARLKYYEDLEEQGLLLRLPVKVGQTVYVIAQAFNMETNTSRYKVFTRRIDQIRGNKLNPVYFVTDGSDSFAPSSIGCRVFLTKAEAEQALEGMTKENEM